MGLINNGSFNYSLHHIDLENREAKYHNIEKAHSDVKSYFDVLIQDLHDDKIKRKFKIASPTSEVCVAMANLFEDSLFVVNSEIIAKRLLRIELSVRDKIKQMKDIKKGSLLQCAF